MEEDRSRIVPPLVIGEGGDLDLFPSVEAAEAYFEPWYALEDYVAFDSRGQRLRLDSGGYTERRAFRFFDVGEVGHFTVQPSGDHDPEDLRDVLVDWLRRAWKVDEASLRASSPGELVETAVRLNGWTNARG